MSNEVTTYVEEENTLSAAMAAMTAILAMPHQYSTLMADVVLNCNHSCPRAGGYLN